MNDEVILRTRVTGLRGLTPTFQEPTFPRHDVRLRLLCPTVNLVLPAHPAVVHHRPSAVLLRLYVLP